MMNLKKKLLSRDLSNAQAHMGDRSEFDPKQVKRYRCVSKSENPFLLCYRFVTKAYMNPRTAVGMPEIRYGCVTKSEKILQVLSRFATETGKKVWTVVVWALLGVVYSVPASATAESHAPLRIGLTATFPNDQYRALESWRLYLERSLQRRIEFIRRDQYIETMDLLRLQKVDFAWICDYPFVQFKNQSKLLAVPLYHGRPYYQSYLIVPAQDLQTTSIAQLKNRVFAYADPYSNTGYLTPRFELQQLGEIPEVFFSKTFFTWGHRKTVEAVATGLAQGGAVSSHVWDALAKVKPELTAATRIVSRSPEYGFSPFVARTQISEAEFRGMQRALLTMGEDEVGRRLLEGLNIDGFVAGEPRFYERVEGMIRAFGKP